ncbi:hypothetical protein ACVNHC_04345 [Pannonibacter sp. Q-1]
MEDIVIVFEAGFLVFHLLHAIHHASGASSEKPVAYPPVDGGWTMYPPITLSESKTNPCYPFILEFLEFPPQHRGKCVELIFEGESAVVTLENGMTMELTPPRGWTLKR